MFKGVFRSRKFWAAFAAVIGVAGSAMAGEVGTTAALQAVVAIVMAYILGVGLENKTTPNK